MHPDDPRPWPVRNVSTVYRGDYMRVDRHACEVPGVGNLDYDVVVAGDWAAMVAVTPEHRLVLERVYRPAVGAVLTELPAGKIDPGDPCPSETARRELLEETGYAVDDPITPVLRAYPATGRMASTAHALVAFGARRVRSPELEPHESLTVFEATFEDALTLFLEASTPVAAVHLAMLHAAIRWILRDDAPERVALRAALAAMMSRGA